ncbi:NUDIX domain-containing protein [Pelagibius litoralis]|uniref:ADP-ribose pyrophosphatase n=1 Tax=Pelagibius litoralis TaxID=374515 RepID=A0A967C2M9_9PROT|nr:NUDIX domain-containing protein [Pelagibius litoralis]NIA67195.1 NUDIX domain-containing protein [Pelagibius litoralis]
MSKPERDPRIEIIEKTTPFKGYFQVDSYRLRHRRFDGGWTREMSREIFERGHAAAVLLYDPQLDHVVLIEQFRLGALSAGFEPWLIEVVAGIIDPGETPEDVVCREALEEAGCEVTALQPVGRYLVSPGGTSETLALFCGRVDAARAGGIHGLEHEGEDIRVLTLPREEALLKLAEGAITNFTAVVALQWLALNYTEIMRKWK